MEPEELIGKTITNIYGIINYKPHGLDTGECFIELDHHIIIDMPDGGGSEVWIKDLSRNAVPLISDLTDEKPYKGGWEKIASLLKRKTHFIGGNPGYIKNRKIVDLLWYPDGHLDRGFLLLDNGCVIGETIAAMNGTGMAGLNYYKNIESLIELKGADFERLIS